MSAGRYRSQTAYGQHIQKLGGGFYRLSWTVDRYYPSSRLRHPVGFQRNADLAGARRFAKKWGLPDPMPS